MKFILCLLLVALSCLGTLGQELRQKQGSARQEFYFQTRDRHFCTVHTSSLGQGSGEVQLRADCHSADQAYWCEYRGQPTTCQAFAADPKTYWNQALQELSRLSHACQGAPVLRPSICQKAGPQAHMQQVASSLKSSPAPNQPSETATVGKPSSRPGALLRPTKATPREKGSMTTLGKAEPATQPTAKATQPGPRSREKEEVKKMIQELCWGPLQALCTFLLSFF
ncbi:fibroblast growth factor-binding protein 2 [Carlito syrichta]|uniref:Fibroblast growth factor-binding protein 2 n=1 Tax=Carlito syrichta TaxID=1868482 RepID=A0A1U7SYY2_CARSF|nr:fibroblast growth factor-binding protein 2 [Carlito syrichta]